MTADRIKYLTYSIAEASDETAFEELFHFYFPGLVSFAGSIVKDRHVAQEVVEDVFVKLWDNRNLLTTIKNFSYYIYTATKYASLDAIKNKKIMRFEDIGDELLLTHSDAEANMISNENLDKITTAINQLPPKCRLIFRLVKEDGMKYDEVAQLLGISSKTVENQMTIALRKIVSMLKTLLPELSVYYQRQKAQ